MAKELIRKRKLLNISQKEVAEGTGLSRMTISRMENGRNIEITSYNSIKEFLDKEIEKKEKRK